MLEGVGTLVGLKDGALDGLFEAVGLADGRLITEDGRLLTAEGPEDGRLLTAEGSEDGRLLTAEGPEDGRLLTAEESADGRTEGTVLNTDNGAAVGVIDGEIKGEEEIIKGEELSFTGLEENKNISLVGDLVGL
jgi:hypothetical protein